MTRLISPFAPGSVLDPEQGGTGLDTLAAAINQIIGGTGSGLELKTLLGSGVTIDTATLGQITFSITPSANGRESVYATTFTVLPNTPTYANGSSGVGATLTAGGNAALLVDGVNPPLGARVGVVNQAAGLQNGIYVVTATGSGSARWVLTRSTDADTSAEMVLGMYFFTEQGTNNSGDGFVLTTTGAIVIGTTALTFQRTGAIIAGTALTLTGNTLDVILGTTSNSAAAGDDARITGALQAANNLSDVVSVSASRTSLGLDGTINGSAFGGAGNIVLDILQNVQSTDYTTVLADDSKQILHPASDNNARTFTIDSNANVPYPVGACITFVNLINTVTISITADTLILAGPGTTGNRTLAANGLATALKVGTTTWIISGAGLT